MSKPQNKAESHWYNERCELFHVKHTLGWKRYIKRQLSKARRREKPRDE